MAQLNNNLSFTERFAELLTLSPSQVSQIQETEFAFHKKMHWDYILEDEERKNAYLKEIFQHLSEKQIQIFDDFVEERKIKIEEKRKMKLREAIEIQANRLKSLNLSDEQLQTYVTKKMDFLRLIRERMKLAKSLEELNANAIKKKVFEEEIYTIFNENQLQEYKALKKEEDRQKEEFDKKWKLQQDIEKFKQTYKLDIGEEQAKRLFSVDFEINFQDAEGEILSDFEMLDEKYKWYKKHLTEDQFKAFEAVHDDSLQNLIDSFKKTDNEHSKMELERTQNYLDYYLANVLDRLVEARQRIESKLSEDEKVLIERIRQLYFNELKISKEKQLIQHHRYFKDFQPNALNLILTRHKFYQIDVKNWYLYGHEITKELITEKVQALIEEEERNLENIFSAMKAFQIENYENTGGTYGGCIIHIPIKEGEEHLEKIGLLLLYPDLEENMKLMEQ